MGRTFEEISPEVAQFIAEQPMFFVATAPSDGGHVNVSPKGLGAVKVLAPREVAYLDLTGSGVETVAHLRQNARITLMFCAFTDKPNIVRVYGHGEAIPVDDDRAAPLLGHFPSISGARTVIRVDVDRVSTSCGYGVPILRYERDRDQLITWAERKGPDGLAEYRSVTNAASIDDLPGLDASS
jgi:hypothetical protein